MSSSSRSLTLLRQLENLNIKYNIVDAIDGSSLGQDDLNKLVDFRSCQARLGYKISPNLIGCFLSHQKIYKMMAIHENNWALILEEDAKIDNFNKEVVVQLINKFSGNPTVIQLFSRSSRLIRKNSVNEVSNGFISFQFLPRIVGSGALAYLINKEAINLALKDNLVTSTPDWPPWIKKAKVLGVYPWMFKESDEGSLIRNNRISRHSYLFRRLLQITGIHYLIYHQEYKGFATYFSEELYPYYLYLIWKFRGSKTYEDLKDSPQVI